VFPITRQKGIGTLLMFAVRSIFADPPRVAREMRELAARGLVEPWLGETAEPLGFLIHEGGAANMIEAAYRFARHEPGVDVVLFGTGDAGHLRTNVASLLKPPLPEADRAKLADLFGHLTGIGLDGHQGRAR
jgi:aryl-alcohol dehydrogenase-like predicted oxidoreductase